jgi:hypothetical protein
MIQLTLLFCSLRKPLHCSRKTDKGGNSIHLHAVDWKNKNQNDNDAVVDNMILLSSRRLRHNLRRSSDYDLPPSPSWSFHTPLNLHHVWDDSFLETAVTEQGYNGSRNAFEMDLLNEIWTHRHEWENDTCTDGSRYDCVNDWADESFDLALRYAYADENGMAIDNGATLSRQYYNTRFPIVRRQLALAGYRLAATLEIVLGGEKN